MALGRRRKKNSPQPILVVNYCIEGLDTDAMVNNVKSIQRVIENSGVNEEYHTFVLPVKTDSNIQVFYDKDFNETSYKEIKEMVENKLLELQNNKKIINKIFGK